ncbi:MAG: cytochrome c [Anaerolineales bacterium]|jgi:mono/diheme cytochrome c family protein
MSPRLRRGLLIIALVLAPFIIGLLFTYEIIKIEFPTDMAEHPTTGYQEGPRILPPESAVPMQGLSVIPEEFPTNPIPQDEVSLQRGKILYTIHCQPCHGEEGHGDGPLADFFDRTPQNLTSPQITAEFDGSVYLTIVLSFGQMPSLAENLTPRERWDVVNYVRTLPSR